MQGNNVLESPYKCDPTDNAVPCKIFYTNDNFFEVPCSCALDGQPKSGYCSNVIGTFDYSEMLVKLKSMQEGNRCHTYDRLNTHSKLDECANINREDLQVAMDMIFKIQYWPYMHNAETAQCIKQVSKNSWFNMQTTGAAKLVLGIVAIIINL
jgi:hypothetical protein